MMYQGTPTYTAAERDYANDVLGCEINSYSGHSFTEYNAQVLVENTHRAFKIFEDMILNSLFDDKQIISEKKGMLKHIGDECDDEGASEVVFTEFYRQAFLKQSIGRRVFGTKESVSSFTREQLLAYKDKHYAPDRMVFSAAGAIEHDEFVAMVAENFARLTPKERPDFAPLKYHGGVVITQREATQSHLVLGFPSVSLHDDAKYTMSMMDDLLDLRLGQELCEKTSMASSVRCGQDAYLDGGALHLYASTNPNRLLELLDFFYEQLNKMVEGVSEQEVELANARYRSGNIFNRENDGSMGVCRVLADDILNYGRHVTLAEKFEKFAKVTSADVSSLTASILKGGRPTLSVVVDQKDDYFEHKVKEKLKILKGGRPTLSLVR